MNDYPWPHAPLHQISEAGTYCVTAGTYLKQPLFIGDERLSLLQRDLLDSAVEHEWQVEAWAVFSNHYHFIAHCRRTAPTLAAMVRNLHRRSATRLNRRDGRRGRQVWHNFWETRLTHRASYFARLSYVHQNAVKHGLVAVANQYPWCSAGWFERTATSAQIETLYRMRLDRVGMVDAF
jgi:putative transposase